jgi:diguanylate cyclase (GGDEF)-like protein/PAS domain S-box-containing protein
MVPGVDESLGLYDHEKRLRAFMRHSPMMAFVKDADGHYVFANPTMERTFGFALAEIRTRADVEWLRTQPTDQNRDREVLETGQPIETVETVPIADGTIRHFLVIRFPLTEPDGRRVIGGVAVDVTALKQAELRNVMELREAQEHLQTLSLTDELTGLHNRRGFFTMASRMLRSVPRTGQEFTVLYIDVDGLKTVNDTYGHDAGSALLVGAADVLKNTFRAADVVGRIGGDEFVAIAAIARAGSGVITERLTTHLGNFNARSGLPYALSLSFGMAYFDPGGSTTLEEVVRQADHAMYEQKRSKRK